MNATKSDVGGIRFVETDKSKPVMDAVKADLEVLRSIAERTAMQDLRKSYVTQRDEFQSKIDWIDSILGTKTIKTKRAPHGALKQVTEGLERYFKTNRGKILTASQLREAAKVASNGFAPSESMYVQALATIRKKFNIETSGSPQMRGYKLV